MFRQLLACLIAASPAAVAHAQFDNQAGNARDWTLEAGPEGCVVHAAAASGTTVSVWGNVGEEHLRFLVQNPQWSALEDGGSYPLQVKFDGRQAWPLDAVARRNLDEDGPGLTFEISPQQAEGKTSFIDQFADAGAMRISQDGQSLDSVALSGNRAAMEVLAQCLSQVYAAHAGAGEDGASVVEVSADARAL